MFYCYLLLLFRVVLLDSVSLTLSPSCRFTSQHNHVTRHRHDTTPLLTHHNTTHDLFSTLIDTNVCSHSRVARRCSRSLIGKLFPIQLLVRCSRSISLRSHHMAHRCDRNDERDEWHWLIAFSLLRCHICLVVLHSPDESNSAGRPWLERRGTTRHTRPAAHSSIIVVYNECG